MLISIIDLESDYSWGLVGHANSSHGMIETFIESCWMLVF